MNISKSLYPLEIGGRLPAGSTCLLAEPVVLPVEVLGNCGFESLLEASAGDGVRVASIVSARLDQLARALTQNPENVYRVKDVEMVNPGAKPPAC